MRCVQEGVVVTPDAKPLVQLEPAVHSRLAQLKARGKHKTLSDAVKYLLDREDAA